MFHKVTIKSPRFSEIEYKYIMNEKHYRLYKELTQDGRLMNLSIFSQLTMAGALSRRLIENTDKIIVN